MINIDSVDPPLWRMFCPDFVGKIEIVKCRPDEEGWYDTIVGNFWIPDEAALNALLPQGKGGSSRAGGAAAGTKLLDDKKRKGDTAAAAGEKVPKLRKFRKTVISKQKPTGSVGKLLQYFASFVLALYLIDIICFVETVKEPIFASSLRSSPLKASDAKGQKKAAEDPMIEVVSSEGTPPVVRVERLLKKTEGDTIADMLDSSNNLIDLFGGGDKGCEKPKSPVHENVSGTIVAGKGVKINLQFSRMRLSWINIIDLTQQGVVLMSTSPLGYFIGGEVINDPSACRETLRGLGTLVETTRARGFGFQSLQNHLASMLVVGSIFANAILEDYTALARREEETIQLRAKAEAMMKTAQAAEEHLEKEKVVFEKLKQTQEWTASSRLKHVRSLANLLTKERKLWKEACARENEKFFHLRQELNNLKAANASLVKEKTAA
ncbi:hypothetical protein Hdeb2414_s0012g00393281 [Helianthus debilis subsp. tardiflorus]